MPEESDSKLINKASELIKAAPIDGELKLLLIELVVRMEDKRLMELLKVIQAYINDTEKAEANLKNKFQLIKKQYDKKTADLAEQTDSELTKLEGEISEDEKEGKIEEVKKKIRET